MKVPLEILFVTVLIWLGWTQSYQEQWKRITGQPPANQLKTRPASHQIAPLSPGNSQPSAPPASPAQPNWMQRPTILDRQH